MRYLYGLFLLTISGLLLAPAVGWSTILLKFTCSYPVYSDVNEAQQEQQNLYEAQFIVKQDEEGNWTGFIDGSQGVGELSVVVVRDLMTLLEFSSSGSPMIATIKIDTEEEKFKSVYSRHASLPGYWNPTQWYADRYVQ